MDLELLDATLAERGEPAFRARQVWEWTARGARGYDEMTDLPAGAARASWPSRCPFSTLALEQRGARLATARSRRCSAPRDGRPVEAVLMRYRDGRRSVCVSLAVGLPADLHVLRHRRDALRAQPDRVGDPRPGPALPPHEPVDHAVFMGMGEPMLNLDAVLAACRRLPDLGITHRRTAISTVGWIPGIERLDRARPAGAPRALAARRRRRAALARSCRSTSATRCADVLEACAALRAPAPRRCSSST